VFTLPHQLAPFALRNKDAFYSLMFRAVKETLLTLAHDPKRLGATVGFVTVLHTWGQTLVDHPHIHCIIPGGGLTDRQRWKACEKKFLFPIPVLQKMFRGKVLDFFKQAVASGEIQFHGRLAEYADPERLRQLVDTLYRMTWVVYVKPPFASPQAVVKYLGQYTHRVAISNYRIQSFENGMVCFCYKDYADANKQKTMTVTAIEFIRRFLLHVVPAGFVRIRHYGFLANRNRPTQLAQCCRLFRKKPPRPDRDGKRTWVDVFKKLKGYDPTRCKQCLEGVMSIVAIIPARRVVLIR
jgi:hypothetical protein